VAEGHGGEVTVTSTLGEGSRFELGLPVRALQDDVIQDDVNQDDVVYGSVVQKSGYPIHYRSGVPVTEQGCETAGSALQRTRAG
jgi:hypothetical protein